MKRIIFLYSVLLVIVFFLNTGCAYNRATATRPPSSNLDAIKTIHVAKYTEDERGVNILIANKLKERGYLVSTAINKPTGIDALVTYKDKWTWDITYYMLELKITFRNPETKFPLATGTSYHTSLTRKTAEGMVDEVLTNIFQQGNTSEN